VLAEQMVADDEIHHRLDHRNRARQDAGVVTTTSSQLGWFALRGDGLLDLRNGGGGLEGEAKEDVFAVADTPLDTA